MYAPWFLSRHSKDLEWRTLKPPRSGTALGSWTDFVIALRSRTDRVIALRQISSILFRRKQENPSSRREGTSIQRCEEKSAQEHGEGGGRGEPFGSSFYMFFSSPWACPMQIRLSQECCSTWSPHSGPGPSFDLPLFCFRGLFSSLSFSHRHFGLLFPILTT